jgi:hypothetical protein
MATDPYAVMLPTPLPDQLDALVPKTDFADYQKPAEQRVMALEALHPHPRDPEIRFIEAPHLYLIRAPAGEQQVRRSVTTVAHSLQPAFDADAIIPKMRNPGPNSQRWPRSGYCIDEQPLGSDELPAKRGVLAYALDAEGKPFTYASLDAAAAAKANLVGATRERIEEVLRGACRKLPRGPLRYSTFKRAQTDAEIKHAWALNATDASDRGTEAHFQAEQYLNGLRMHETPDLEVCRRFCRDHLLPAGARPYRTEWRIYTDLEAEGIAGSIDLVIEMPDGSLGLVDWKRSVGLASGMWGFPGSTMFPPFEHLDNCSGSTYALQLNIYAWVLEKYYDRRITSLTLCSIHPDKPYTTAVPFLPLETEYLMALERQRTARCRAVRSTEQPPGVLCQLTGAVRTHPKIAVMPSGERLLVQHGALYRDGIEQPVSVEDEPDGDRAAQAALLRAETPVEDAEVEAAARALAERRVEWTEVMPKPLLEPFVGRKRPRDESD